MAPMRIRIDGGTFRDKHNREVTLHGINVAGDSKLPRYPDMPSHVKNKFFLGDSVSFVDRPFSMDEAHEHFTRLKRWGYNTIRYIFTWEAIEHEGPGKYDEDFIKHTIEVLRLAKSYGFYVFMDPHQDVWSRFTGGSGAPMWTVYACGLDPTKFINTQAALVQNTWPNPADFPKMIWATNYTRLACQVIFTMFFAGKDFTPKCVIDGKNIQDYLQDHFVAACKHLAQRIHEAGDLEGDVVIGYESVNEPNKGLIAHPDLSVIPSEQNLQKGTSPTAWQAILTGSGRACEVDTWEFGGLGPYKSGKELIDPNGQMAWLDPKEWSDTKYGWKRSESWKLGECIWAQHGVWDPTTDTLHKPKYFAKHPKTGEKLDNEYFINNYFMYYYRKYRNAVREVWPEAIMLLQPTPFEIPPSIQGTEDDDSNMIFASHFYDGITLITKKWNRFWNVDVFGILRGKYLSPAFAIKVGETAIRNCFRDQLSAIRQEGIDYMGVHPCMYTEIGIPYDMDDRYAYKTGDYTSQALAIDANHFAVEHSKAQGFTWWLYSTNNTHEWGDSWNGEDLSILSHDDRELPLEEHTREDHTTSNSATKTPETDPSRASFSASRSSDPNTKTINPTNLKKTLSVDRMSHNSSSTTTPNNTNPNNAKDTLTLEERQGNTPGYRAAEAYVRPTPIATAGDILDYGFNLRNCVFTLQLSCKNPAPADAPTEIFLPGFHFPADKLSVTTSGGKWSLSADEGEGEAKGLQQVLKWWHPAGQELKLEVSGVKRRVGMVMGREEEEPGYLQQYVQMGKSCAVM
ncbi:hypothetical protein MBLNU230_g7165t1 [Neophaeotheca triangularis]